MDGVIKLKGLKTPSDPAIIDMLEQLLKDAKDGSIIEMELVAKYSSGMILSAGAGRRMRCFEMFGALTDAALSYRETHIETNGDV